MIKTKILFLVFLALFTENLFPCTLGVAGGKATSDGRPLLWKTRDYEIKTNILFYTRTDKYNFISNITPEYGFEKSWFGTNDRGFAIANTYIQDFPKGKNGPENGEFMSIALKSCITVADFQRLLDSTNITGRKTQAVFGVIDSLGGAAIFEVSDNRYWMYDANDENIAPDGYIVKTNFTINGGGFAGIERYKRSSFLINDFFTRNSLNVKNILQIQMRDINDNEDNPEINPFNSGGAALPEYFDCRKNICTPYSIAGVVIQGVKKNEPAFLTTTWTMLSNPFTSVAIPYWVAGDLPALASSVSECSLYGISNNLRKILFDNSNRNFVNIPKCNKIKKILSLVEDSIYGNANNILEKWRKVYPQREEMLQKEKQFVNYAYTEISKVYLKFATEASREIKDSRIITLDNFSDNGVFNGSRTIRISLPPGYFQNMERCRVIYFFDGERSLSGEKNDQDYWSADYYRDILLDENLIYPAIFVAIHNNGNRSSELTPTRGKFRNPGGKLEQFYKFITGVLKPYIDSNFRTMKEPAFTGISGHSYGGLAAAWLAYMHPETFGMAGCMSPSFWWDDRALLHKMANEDFSKPKPKFWIMSADIEYPGMWIDARTAAKTLTGKDWEEGKNLAYYHVYGGNHNHKACNNQMRNMLYFLLRKERPELKGINIKNILSSAVEPLDIEALGEDASLLLELQYTNGYRANAISPDISISNPDIAVMKDSINGFITPVSKGWTNINMKYKNFQTSLAVKSFDITDYKRFPLYKTVKNIKIDGIIDEWGSPRYSNKTNTVDSIEYFTFDVNYNEEFINFAFKIPDDTVYVDTTARSIKRDGITLYFDARPDPLRSLGRGRSEWDVFIPIALSPGKTQNDMRFEKESNSGHKLPAGVKAGAIITEYGYSAEIAIPVSYLIEKQGVNWNEFRINVCRNKINDKNNSSVKKWWMPEWKSKENYNGSGTFRKKEK